MPTAHHPPPAEGSAATLGDLIRLGAEQFERAGLFFGHGTDNAVDEAAYLASYALGLPPDFGRELLGRIVDEAERARVLGLFRRRIAERIPAAYLTHEAWFCGLPFYVDERVLIPRSPIGELIDDRFHPWKRADSITRILDIGTGSGCIAIACAVALPHAEVVATDISDHALAVAAINTRRHRVQHRVRLLRSDLYSGLEPGTRFDLIVSNPPYVDRAAMADLPTEYRVEPTGALAAGEQGLDIVVPLIEQAYRYLQPDGILVVEVGDSADGLVERLPELPFLWLEFERGGHGVFLLEADQLARLHHGGRTRRPR